ncbi:MAG: hypothetical protein IH600_10790, partial [Bacteroidetes bacterium]|nr:hypothetical protein [Bacteroidota bacterium]
MYYSAAVKVNDNTVVQRTSGTTTTSGYGMYIYYPNLGPEVKNNYIYARLYGLYFRYANYNYSSTGMTTALRGKVINNMIIVDHSSSSTMYGMYTYYSRYTDFAFNTLSMRRTYNTTATVYGIYHSGTSSNYMDKFKNNYIVHDGYGTFYAMYNATLGDHNEYDFNAYWRTGTGTTYFRWGSTSYTSLAALQSAVTGYHQNSVWGDPYFISMTDLHSRSHVAYQAGVPFAGVTDDFDGQTRGAAPCIGADEYPAPPAENDVALEEVMLGYAEGQWVRQEGSALHPVRAVLENVGLGPNPTTVPITYKLGSMPANSGDGVQETFTPTWNGNKAAVEFTQKVTGLAVGPVALYVKIFWTTDENNSNDSGMDGGEVFAESVHGFRSFEYMDPGVYPLTREPGYLDLPWTITDNNGGSTLEVTTGVGTGGSNGLAMIVPTEAADEWLITPGAALEGGGSYRLAFDFQNAGGSPVTIEAAFGDTPDPSQMTVFATFANIAPGGFLTAKQLAGGLSPYFNTPLVNTDYYVALHFTTSGSNAQFVLDNIKLDDNPSPPPKIAFGLPGTDLSTFIDNPATKLTFIANYKVPGIINRTYEVQSKT